MKFYPFIIAVETPDILYYIGMHFCLAFSDLMCLGFGFCWHLIE